MKRQVSISTSLIPFLQLYFETMFQQSTEVYNQKIYCLVHQEILASVELIH